MFTGSCERPTARRRHGRAGGLVVLTLGLLVATGCTSPAASLPSGAATPASPAVTTTPSRPISQATVTPQATATPEATPMGPAEVAVCGEGSSRGVVLMVTPALKAGLEVRLAQFETDLCADGYFVFERRADFATPPEARGYLKGLLNRTGGRLQGAYVVGDIPHAYQTVFTVSTNPAFPSISEEVLSFQYYADLDGTFSASTKSRGGHEYSYDVHSGEVGWELWVAVLPMYKGSVERTVTAINAYLARNHAFRSGGPKLPRALLQIDDLYYARTTAQHDTYLAGLKSGPYAWTPLSNQSSARLYFNSVTPPGSVQSGYDDLSAGVADLTVFDAHGNWESSGIVTIEWVESKPIRTFVLWSNACAVGNLDKPDNFLTSVLYSSTSAVLVAKGTTNDSGGMGNNKNGSVGHNVATSIAAGRSVGEALLGHVNVPLIAPWSGMREFHFGTVVMLGDPTIRLRA
jgi:hypothetical protein